MQNLNELQTLLKQCLNVSWEKLPFVLQKYPAPLRKMLIEQIEGRKKIQHKIPSWHKISDLLFPATLSVEQCSSEKTAFFKANLLSGKTLIDLTGGFGVDTWAFAQTFEKVWYVEKNPDLFQITKHNFEVLGLTNVSLHNQTAQDFLQNFHEKVDSIYLDPARRDKQGKSIAQITDTEPNILELLPQLFEKTEKILLKTSPMFEIKEALKILPNVASVYVVSVQNECKEVLYLLQKNTQTQWHNVPIHTYNLLENQTESFTATYAKESELSVNLANTLSEYLYEPNSAILKAGFFKSIAERFALQKLHPHTHLYTHKEIITDFAGRIFRVKKMLSNPQRELAEIGSKWNILARNYPLSVAEICKKYKLQEGGNEFLIATTMQDNRKVLVWAERIV